jgi:hypothetical protein
MTTHVLHIINSSDSNPAQHARVEFKVQGSYGVLALAPGESKGWWISPDDEIRVVEIFEPKPAPTA